MAEEEKHSSDIPEEMRDGDESKGKAKASTKRKRSNLAAKDQWKKDQENYYNRLVHSAEKDLKKQAKIVRNFECQKLIRKLKEQKAGKGAQLPSANHKLEELKNLELEKVVQESFRRLGIRHLDPKVAVNTLKDGKDSNVEQSNEKNDTIKVSLSENEKGLVERIMKHKKMQSAMEKWNDQVTEYRRWCLQQQERESGFSHSNLPGYKEKKRKRSKAKDDKEAIHDREKSLFLRLGKEDDDSAVKNDNNTHEAMPHYGPGSFVEGKKKNRKGQRARKAKAIAIEEKIAGRAHRAANSVNWRRTKQQHLECEEKPHQPNTKRGQNPPAEPFSETKTATGSEKLHPSWVAAKKGSSGIVQFQGTKITF